MSSDHTQRLWSALVAVYQPVLRDVVTVLERDAGIDSGTYSVLAYLDQAGGTLRLRELHDLMRVRYSQPGLSRLVQRMTQDGIVERRPDPEDGRGAVVALTRTGRTRFRQAHEVYTAALEEQLGASLSAAAATALARDLERLAERRSTDRARG
ncbi:MAG: MarR family winged helix-turn-helix transcriptional regulator [Acidimicrobiia bacterium]